MRRFITPENRRWAGVALVATVGVGVLVWCVGPRSRSDDRTLGRTHPVAHASDLATRSAASTAPPPMAPARSEAPAPWGVAATPEAEALAAALSVEDDVAQKIRRIEAAVGAGALDALPVLTSVSLAREPGTAPSVIHAVAAIAAQGSVTEQRLAVRSLSRWLREETSRDGRDAIGNVANIIEALGHVDHRESVDALVEALDSGRGLDLALQTSIVQRLGALGDPRARDAIARFARRIPPPGEEDDAFEQELHNEALAASREALAALTH